ncbi:MAG: Uma2 family endonuclease [Verrucomicrobia bacterium]|nr:Uma2 family endonuclease [Verrucomicrobiota bacterium]
MLPRHLRELQGHLAEERRKRREFQERVEENAKAEFIEGEIIMHSPVSLGHSVASDQLFTLLHAHVSRHGLGAVRHEKVMVSLTRSDYEPGICFFSAKKAARFKRHQRLFPAPDFIVEVLSDSTEKTDRTKKMEDYAAHGVQEYWLVDPDRERVEQYLLKSGDYELATKTTSGEIRAQAIKGFVCPVRAIFDPAANLRALQAILLSGK